MRLVRADPLRHQPAAGKSSYFCKNDVICEFHSPKTMELILVVVISAGMAENSQNGVSRSLNPWPSVGLDNRPTSLRRCIDYE